MSWSPEDTNRLRELADLGWSARRIGKALNKTRNAVIGRAWRMGIQLHGRSGPQIKEEETHAA